MKVARLEHMELYKETKFSNNDMKTKQPYSFCAEENRSPLLQLQNKLMPWPQSDGVGVR